MKWLFPVLALLAFAAASAEAPEVYRTIQADGTVVYSDRPLSPDSVLVAVNTRPASAEAAATASGSAAASGSARSRDDTAGKESGMAAAVAEQKAMRAEACREAQAAAEAYERSPRLYEELPDGGRRYLSDEEIAEARQNARQAVVDFCDNDG